MNLVVISFVFLIGICASILRRKLFKKLLGLYVSLNSLFVLLIIVSRNKADNELEAFSLIFLSFCSILFVIGFLACHYSKKRNIKT